MGVNSRPSNLLLQIFTNKRYYEDTLTIQSPAAVTMYFHLLYGVFYTFFLILYVFIRSKTQNDYDIVNEFRNFQSSDLSVYLITVAGDLLQRPHLYVLYESYELSKQQIGVLFAAGIASGVLFEAFLGVLLEKFDCRKNCVIYAFLQIFACTANHFVHFPTLIFGRVLAGIAFTILTSFFNSWELYIQQGFSFSKERLPTRPAKTFFGSLLVAIFSGLVSQFLAEKVGLLAPFDFSIFILLVFIPILRNSGSESNGNQKPASVRIRGSIQVWKEDPKILYLGLAQSLFESSLHLFSFLWTPIIVRAAGAHTLPHGHIFAAVMISTLIGSSASKCIERRLLLNMYSLLFLAAAGLSISVFKPDDFIYVFSGFLTVGCCSGAVLSILQNLYKTHVPKEHTKSITLLRVPIYSIVIIILSLDLPVTLITKLTAALLLSASIAHFAFFKSFKSISQYKILSMTEYDHNNS